MSLVAARPALFPPLTAAAGQLFAHAGSAMTVALPEDVGDQRLAAARYLAPGEAAALGSACDRRRSPFLLGRIAVKDAVSSHLMARGFAEIGPTRIVIGNDIHGCPQVRVRGAGLATRGLCVSIAHKGDVAVGLAATVRSGGIGADVERVEERLPSFERAALTPEERGLDPGADDRDTWLTRLWTVKEAAAKATGRGLRGRPRDFEVEPAGGGRFRCAGSVVSTLVIDVRGVPHVISWTEAGVGSTS